MKYLALAALCLLSSGCDAPSKPAPAQTQQAQGPYWVTVQGTIWYVQTAKESPDGRSHVIIETDDHQAFTVNLLDVVPPAVVGVKGVFAYESAGNTDNNGLWKNFIMKQRLDAEGPHK